jgi:hypothetical protein
LFQLDPGTCGRGQTKTAHPTEIAGYIPLIIAENLPLLKKYDKNHQNFVVGGLIGRIASLKLLAIACRAIISSLGTENREFSPSEPTLLLFSVSRSREGRFASVKFCAG